MTHKTYSCPTCDFVLSEEEFDDEADGDCMNTCPVCWDYEQWQESNGLCANTRNMIVLFKKSVGETV